MGERVAIEEIARREATDFFAAHFHALDVERHVRVHCLVRPGSRELIEMMRRRDKGVPLCNDTSCGVGFSPLTELERIVLAVERRLNAAEARLDFPACGQDVKILGVRDHERITLTIACAMIGRFLASPAAYAEAKRRVAELALDTSRAITDKPVKALVNAADDERSGAIYLTVTGTSAESGDDGETGRGNRSNGLITPFRPMTLEAAAGKNPLTHVGKLYNAAARQIADDLVSDIGPVEAAECYLTSRIGAPIDRPQTIVVRLATIDGEKIGPEIERLANEVVARRLSGVARLWEDFLLGTISVLIGPH
jgi:S-adenosylmethionine synthetase